MFGFAPFESELSVEHDSCLLKNINEKDRRKKSQIQKERQNTMIERKETMKERQKTMKENKEVVTITKLQINEKQ